jgi:hypothetical protein
VVNAIQVSTRAGVAVPEPVINQLAARDDVDSIRGDEHWEIPVPLAGSNEPTVQAVEWGVARVHAPDVWDQFGWC